jgi:hypothetical protein
MDIGKLFEAIDEEGARTRSNYHLTLGNLIQVLEAAPESAKIGIGKPHSYRGYYRDLAFEPCTPPRPASEVLIEARACIGKVFTGYKGGTFEMDETTPLWIATWGSCGDAFMGLEFTNDGTAILQTKRIEY